MPILSTTLITTSTDEILNALDSAIRVYVREPARSGVGDLMRKWGGEEIDGRYTLARLTQESPHLLVLTYLLAGQLKFAEMPALIQRVRSAAECGSEHTRDLEIELLTKLLRFSRDNLQGTAINVFELQSALNTDPRFRSFEGAVDILAPLVQFQERFDAMNTHYRVEPTQRKFWQYDATCTRELESLFARRPEYSGHFATHQMKNSLEMVGQVLASGHLLGCNALTVNERGVRFTEGVSRNISTRFVHFTVDSYYGGVTSPYAVVYPLEVLLENHTFWRDPFDSYERRAPALDWAVGGDTPSLRDPTYQVPLDAGVILFPASQRREWNALCSDITREHPEWKPPTKVWFYDDTKTTRLNPYTPPFWLGMHELKEAFPTLATPERQVAISGMPQLHWINSRERNTNIDSFKPLPMMKIASQGSERNLGQILQAI